MKLLASPTPAHLAKVALLSILVPVVLAHGGDESGMDMDMNMGATAGANETQPEVEYPPTYFGLDEHKVAIYGHIALMVIAWVFMLPVGKC